MRIPKQNILKTLNTLEKLEAIRNVHFRELVKTIDHTNFQTCTRVDFKAVVDTYGKPHETFGRLKHQYKEELLFEFTSRSGSKYFVTSGGDVYRLSNHWGAVASCCWTREGKGELQESVFICGDWEIGVANLSEFKIFVRKNKRRVDMVINPTWVEKVKPMAKLKSRLSEIMVNEKFPKLSSEDKRLVGSTNGKLKYLLETVKEYDDSLNKIKKHSEKLENKSLICV